MSTPLQNLSAPPRLVLGSGSAARAALLSAAGLVFERVPASVDERAAELAFGTADAPAVALGLARIKALEVSARRPGDLVIGADQTLDCDGRRFDKPAGLEQAREQLAFLAGRQHRLSSSVVLVRDGQVLWHHTGEVRLVMKALDDAALARYLEAAGPAALASVGAYQLEGPGVRLFKTIEGDYFTVLGLPLLPLLAELEHHGFAL